MTEQSKAIVVREIGESRALATIRPIVPTTPQEVGEYAQFLIEQEILPDSYATMPAHKKRGAVIIAILKGLELGLTPTRALESIYIIGGKPALYGDMVPGLLLSSGKLEWFKEGYEGDGDNRFAWFEAKRAGNAEPVRRTFSVANAAAMRLLGKQGPWQHSRDRMLMIRARTYVFRDLFADVLAGLSVVEEQSDVLISQGRDAVAFPSLPATEEVDPLADAPLIESQVIPDAPTGLVWWGEETPDPETPAVLAPPPQTTKAAWQRYSKALRGLIEHASTDGLKLTWWDLNGKALEEQSADAAKWVQAALPAVPDGEEDHELGDRVSAP